jgi:molecular chaperone DnaK (HSP70)
MRAKETIEKRLAALSEDERKEIESIIQDLKAVLQGKEISEDVVKKLNNVSMSVGNMKDNFMWRLLRAAKQNHML